MENSLTLFQLELRIRTHRHSPMYCFSLPCFAPVGARTVHTNMRAHGYANLHSMHGLEYSRITGNGLMAQNKGMVNVCPPLLWTNLTEE